MAHRGWMIAGWATATVLAVVLGLQGIRAVSESVSDNRRPSLSAAGVRAALSSSSSSSASSSSSLPSSSSDAVDGESPSSASSSSPGAPVAVDPGTGGDTGSATQVAPPAAVSADNGSAGEDESSSSSSTTAGSAAAPTPIDETYQLVGGTVTVRYENNGARVVWASPSPGFEVENDGGDDSTVDVRFHNEDHESRLRAWWDNGPQHSVEEKND